MTDVGSVYGEALYDLARDEKISADILAQLNVLEDSFRQEPDFVKLLSTPSLSKQERCQILQDAFGSIAHPYVLNFMKLLTEKGYARHFSDCCESYREHYNEDNGILVVRAITAVPLSPAQGEKLSQKLTRITGKTIQLRNKVDPAVMGGMQLDLGNKRLDDTVAHRLDAIRSLLKDTTI